MKRKSLLATAIATVALGVLAGIATPAQDKYSLTAPSGIALSDFRGYENWTVVPSAQTDELLKAVVVANRRRIADANPATSRGAGGLDAATEKGKLIRPR